MEKERMELWGLDKFAETSVALRKIKKVLDEYVEKKKCETCDSVEICELAGERDIIIATIETWKRAYNDIAEEYNSKSDWFGLFPEDANLPECFELYEVSENDDGFVTNSFLKLTPERLAVTTIGIKVVDADEDDAGAERGADELSKIEICDDSGASKHECQCSGDCDCKSKADDSKPIPKGSFWEKLKKY